MERDKIMNSIDVPKAVQEAIISSEVILNVAKVKETIPAINLTTAQITKLKKNGNVAEDWKLVKVADGFDPDRVRNSSFYGEVILGKFDEKVAVGKNIELPSGIYNSTLINSIIGDNAIIRDVKLLANYWIKEKAVVFNIAEIATQKATAFGNGVELSLAIETGGREVKTYGEITIDVATKIASSRKDKQLLAEYDKLVAEYVSEATSEKGIVCEGAVVKNTAKVLDTFVGPYAIIDNAIMVVNTTILSNKDEKTEVSDGAYVKNSIIQWGSEVTSMGVVDSSVLTEHSHVEREGLVTNSILGPNTGVAEGEVTASLVGPFVGFHHQSLLIAAYWPEGKGNVGYGANVGSNHTSRVPDQEIWCGEGTFFGLSVSIKFPANFSKSPYTILATGVTTLPQKVAFPFALINSPAEFYPGVPPAYNELIPGWVLSDNLYSVKRNEGKYMKRNKAKRSKFVFEVLRPEIIDLMLDARQRLQIAQVKEVYTDKDVKGLGKNFLLEKSRKKGIETYTYFIQYYALLGLKKKVAEVLASKGKGALDILLTTASDCPRWEHERNILQAELAGKSIVECLQMLAKIQPELAKSVQLSREKDDERGVRVISDYLEARPPAKEDGFVKETWMLTEKIVNEIDALVGQLQQ
ncbi:MAG: DUF4954 family protein [bacterium]|nr:DUF4954 family protein [bacterium]